MVASLIPNSLFLGKYGLYNFMQEAHILSKYHEEL